MSAYIMQHDLTISSLVNHFADPCCSYDRLWIETANGYEYLTRENAASVAEMLYNKNVDSVDYRYSETNERNFVYCPSREVLSNKEVNDIINSLEYQSCEAPDYFASKAFFVLCAMRKDLLRRVLQEQY